MRSIETTQIDQYSQTILKDRSLPVEERALSASLAMRMHVLTEFGLPVHSGMPMTEDDAERVFWAEASLEHAAESHMADLMGASMAAFDWMEDNHPEDEPSIMPGLLRLVEEVRSFDGTILISRDVHDVLEGNAAEAALITEIADEEDKS